jgi:nucleoside-diphosphate-sugar epimerase
MFKTNVDGTANLVNIALDFPIKKIIYISSIAAIGANPLKGEIDETLNWEKHQYNTEYGLSKQLAEREIIRGVSEGLTATIVNPGIILGEGQWHKTTGRIWENIWNGQLFTLKGQNGFIDIKDVIIFSVAAMKDGENGNRYILVSENVDYQLLFTKIAKSINKKNRFIIAPTLLQKLYVIYDWFKSLITNSSRNLTNETLKISNVKFSFTNKKAIKELGINFTPINKTIDRISTSFLKTKNVNNNG